MGNENEVNELLAKLRDGEITLDEVAERFRRRRWPRRRRPVPASYEDLATRAQEDPDPWLPGSWDDVSTAYHRHEISDDQYDILAVAAAEAERAEDRGEL